MVKKTVKTKEYEYDKNRNVTRIIETITEEDIYLPSNPFISPSIPHPFKPYVGDVWNQPDSGGKTYTNTGGEPLRVTYDEQV